MFDLGLLELETKRRSKPFTGRLPQQIVQHASRAAIYAGGSQGARDCAGRPIHLQFFRLPIAARSLGAGATFPDHADPSAERTARTQWHAGRYHLRFRREGFQVHRSAGRARHAAAASDHTRRNRITSASSWSAPIRTSWATCTIFLAA